MTSTETTSPVEGRDNISSGTIAGIVVGGISAVGAAATLCIAGGFFAVKKYRSREAKKNIPEYDKAQELKELRKQSLA